MAVGTALRICFISVLIVRHLLPQNVQARFALGVSTRRDGSEKIPKVSAIFLSLGPSLVNLEEATWQRQVPMSSQCLKLTSVTTA